MDDVHCIPFRQTGYFSNLICDYLDQKESLKGFYHRFPNKDSFKAQIEEKSGFPAQNRAVLVKSLKAQYASLKSSDLVSRNIDLLKESNTYTVTTGHQLCLFTGPLYFIYKIVSAVNSCEQLSQQYPEQNFVPVYWMASEDHDFPEINHINYSGGRISWERDASGPVGRLTTESLKPVLEELQDLLGPGHNAQNVYKILEDAYLGHSNLADATRYLVDKLFSDKGVIVIDADDPDLKSLAISYFEKDLFDNEAFQYVNEASKKLEESYFNQIHPREINLFYIKDGLRERIEKNEGHWQVLNSDIQWNEEKLRKELNDHPERFSPNVVLRPLYQEVILPNLAYIGGGGELAYWFQLKHMFDQFHVPFPMLMLRNSVLGISNRQKAKLDKMGIGLDQMFKPLHQIQNDFAAQSAPVDPELDDYHKMLEQMFNDLEAVANLTDRSMLGAVNAQRQKQLNGLEKLKKKLLRAEKRKNSDLMERIQIIHSELFPKSGLQERHDNFIAYYLEYGDAWLKGLYEQLDPFKFEFTVASWSN